MRWPNEPVQNVRPSRFMPPFCPWPKCRAHRSPGQGFYRNGSYRTKCSPKRIPRYLCLDCKRTCSRQTFSTTYYLKRPALQVPIASGLAACSCHRQLARSLHCAKTSVNRQAERLGRHAILFHARCCAHLPALAEPVVHDHFETFIGRRPDRKPESGTTVRVERSYAKSITRSIQGLIPKLSESDRLVPRTDGRTDYRAALHDDTIGVRVDLQAFPNPVRGPKGTPRSPEVVARDFAMFPIDQLHQLLRHTCSNHKREAIAFGRRLGLTEERWRFDRILARRLFVKREPVPESALRVYQKLWTRGLPRLALRHAG